MSELITNLDPPKKVLLLLGGLSLPFDDASVVLIKRFVASAVGKIHKLRTAKLRELETHFCNSYYCKPFQFLAFNGMLVVFFVLNILYLNT